MENTPVEPPVEPQTELTEATMPQEGLEPSEGVITLPEVHPALEAIEKMKSALRSGNDIETAAHFAGQSLPTVYRWLELGKIEAERVATGLQPVPEHESFLEFWEELRQARAEAIVRNVAFIQTAAKNGSWQAAAWWLERTVPETYSRSKTAKLTDQDG
jgi:hypothetical protein